MSDERDIPVIPSDWAYPKYYKQTIELADGTVLNGYIRRSSISDKLWAFLPASEFSYMDLVQMFSNPEKTRVMISNDSEDSRLRYEGYTRLASITSGMDETFTIGLMKPIG